METNKHFLTETEINGNNIEIQDEFNFNKYAIKVKEIIQNNSKNKEPLTIGIYGKWGEGKTSFSNLIKHKIEHFDDENKKEYIIYNFNPWRYSTEDEMLFNFFDDIKKKFFIKDKTELQEIGKYLSKYSKYLKAIKISATVGLPKILNSKIEFSIDKIFEALGEDLKGENITLENLKNKINEELNKKNFKILVFIDDIDRLDDNEIYTLFKLVKLNASFDNFIFILNFDEEHVSKALSKRYGKENEDGKLFIEKIINIAIHVPKIEAYKLQEYFYKKLVTVLINLGFDLFKQQEIKSGIDFLDYKFNTPRQIIRVLNSFFIDAYALKDDVNLIELFAIEYIKILNPNLYNRLKKINNKKSENTLISSILNDSITNSIQKILDEDNENELFANILKKLFINKSFEEEKLPIKNPNYYDRYFTYHIGDNIPEELFRSIKEGNYSDNNLEKLFNFDDSYYKILELIYIFKTHETRDNLYFNIVKNIELLPYSEFDYFGMDNKDKIIEKIAIYLDENIDEDNSEISKKIAKILDVYKLCYLIRKYKDNKTYKKDLINILIEKLEIQFNPEKPVFIQPSIKTKMTMIFWSNEKPESFNKHIIESVTDKAKVKKLIRNFPIYTLGKLEFGSLIKRDFDYMSEIIDVNFVFNKIKELDENIINSVDINKFKVKDETEESNEDENLKQFIYWYKKQI